MLIIANGGYRTGSTLIFNIIKEIFNEYKLDFEQNLLDISKINQINDYKEKNYVIKSHNFLPTLKQSQDKNIKTIYTRRHFLDVYSSLKKYGITHLDYLTEILEEKRRQKYMLNYEHLCLDYEDFYNREEFAIKKISNYINIPCNNINIIKNKLCKKNAVKNDYIKSKHISKDPSPYNFINELDCNDIKNIINKYRKG